MAEPQTQVAGLVAEIEALGGRLGEARASVARRFIGQEAVVDQVLAAMLCGGHVLLVGLPGLRVSRPSARKMLAMKARAARLPRTCGR